jgi:hypothetical protein
MRRTLAAATSCETKKRAEGGAAERAAPVLKLDAAGLSTKTASDSAAGAALTTLLLSGAPLAARQPLAGPPRHEKIPRGEEAAMSAAALQVPRWCKPI